MEVGVGCHAVGMLGRGGTSVATVAAVVTAGVLSPGTAVADENQTDGLQHNITYRARVDGLARGAQITYKITDTLVNSADPTMLPGRTFEATAVLDDPRLAGMSVSIQWPYSANLHCEILVDEATVAQADEFVAPRLTPARDVGYGTLTCGAPLDSMPGLLPPGVPTDAPPDAPTDAPTEAPADAPTEAPADAPASVS